MKTALFVNFSDEAFSCSWDGKPYNFAPGEKKFMPDFLATHFAKHLANRELLKKGHETATSPKKPEQVPLFMEFFNKACIIEEDQIEKTQLDLDTELANKNREDVKSVAPKEKEGDSSEEAQVINVPDDEEDEDDEKFEGLEQ